MELPTPSYTLRAPFRRVVTVPQPTVDGSDGGGGAAEGAPTALVVEGHNYQLIVERLPDGGALRARRAPKVKLAGTWLLRGLLCYGAAVLLGYTLIFCLNLLLKYVMAVFLPLLAADRTVPLAFLSLSVLPAVMGLLAALAAAAAGVLLDIWNDFEWISVSPMPLPPLVRQWVVFSLILLVPIITYAVTIFLGAAAEAYTAALLASLSSLLLLLLGYFASITAAEVALCMALQSRGAGVRDTLRRLLAISVEAHGALPLPACLPLPSSLRESAVAAEGNGAPDTAASSPSRHGDPLHERGSKEAPPGPEAPACQQAERVGWWRTGARWAPKALDPDNRAIIVPDDSQVFHIFCCLSSRAQMQANSISAFLSLVIISGLIVLSGLGSSLTAANRSASLVLASVVLVGLILGCCLGSAMRRTWPRTWTPTASLETAPVPAYQVDPGEPTRRILIAKPGVLMAWFVLRLLLLAALPMASFLAIAQILGFWYMTGIVLVACAYLTLVTVFDVKMVLQSMGPAGMVKLEGISWRKARQAYLLLGRMNVRNARRGFGVFLWVMAIMFLVIAFAGIEQPPSTYPGVQYVEGLMASRRDIGQRYPACDMAEPIPGISVLDYAFLSDVAYIHNTTQAQLQVEKYFGANGLISNYTYESTRLTSGLFNSTFGFYYRFQVPNTQSYIIAIRGTSTFLDLIADANLWLEVSLIQLLRLVLPLGVAWDPAYPYLIEALHIDNGNEAFQYHYDIEQEVEALVQQGATVVLTGHSLGGGLGLIVSASEAVPATVFSAPNAMLSRLKFNITAEALNTWPVNIRPSGDPVAMVDFPGILSQSIDCSAPPGMACHGLLRAQCELEQTCGSGGRPAIEPSQCVELGYGNSTLVERRPRVGGSA